MNKSTKPKTTPVLEDDSDYTLVSLKNAGNSLRTAIMQLAYNSNPKLIIMGAEILSAWSAVEACYSVDKEFEALSEEIKNAL